MKIKRGSWGGGKYVRMCVWQGTLKQSQGQVMFQEDFPLPSGSFSKVLQRQGHR